MESMDLTKDVDELDLEAKLKQMFPKQKKRIISDKEYENRLLKGC